MQYPFRIKILNKLGTEVLQFAYKMSPTVSFVEYLLSLEWKGCRINRQEDSSKPAQELSKKKPCWGGSQNESWSAQLLTDWG
jgi:hypothetical protein